MKPIKILIGLTLMFFPLLQALASQVDFGVKAGLNLHTGSYDATQTATQATKGTSVNFGLGLAGGLGAELHFTELISLETDLMWITRGHVLSTSAGGVETNVRNGYNTLALPVLFKFSFGSWDFIPYLGVGLEPYYIISAGSTTTKTNTPAASSTIASSTLNPLNVGITGNLGFAYYWGDVGGVFDVRYTYGMTNAANGSATDILRNQDIITMLGVIFRI